MSAWKDSDEVTTTYGSIQLSLEQAHSAGIKTEQQRIIKLLEENSFEQTVLDSMGVLELPASIDLETAIALIKGETNE